jgi:hypothetical protein
LYFVFYTMFSLYIKYEVLTLSVVWKDRTHDVPISLFRDESYACDNNDKIF